MRLVFLLFLAALLPGPPEGVSAQCPKGTLAIGGKCEDDDECIDAESRSQRCGDNSVCYNTNGSYYCQCVTGYRTRSKEVNFTIVTDRCGDINECTENKHNCSSNTKCNNIMGSYRCACSPGYKSNNGKKVINSTDGVTCSDINECEVESFCGSNAECHNTIGSYECSCKPGFEQSNNKNTFIKSDEVTCNDIDECEGDRICPNNADCYNTPGYHYCTCKLGFLASNNQEKFNETGVKCEETNVAGGKVRLFDNNGQAGTCKGICGEGTEPKKNNSGKNNDCKCECKDGYINLGIKNNTCTQIPKNDLLNKSSSAKIPKQFEKFSSELNDTYVNLTNGIIPKQVNATELLKLLLKAIDDLLSAGRLNDRSKVSVVLETVEGSLKLLGLLLIDDISESSKHTRVQMLVSRDSTTVTKSQGSGKKNGRVKMSTEDVTLVSNWSNAAGNDPLGFASMALISYQGLENSTDQYFDWIKNNKSATFKMNSNVISVAVTNPNTSHLQEPVTLAFTHFEENQFQSDKGEVICVFWDLNLTGGAWSTEGCSVISSTANQTTCSCTHLSSFAVLLALYDQEPVFELQLITWIGLSLSLLCLFISILTFQFIRSIKSTRTTIHLHLCISLFIADLVFLAGISQTQNKVGCGVVAGLLHFFFLAVFCWMCLEGVQLFRMVVLVFNTTVKSYYLMAAGYGVPALIVAISAGINSGGYGTEHHCWLNIHDGFIWSFFGPVCFIIIVNAFFFFITVLKLAQKFSSLNTEMGKLRKIRSFTITAIAQLCVLGTMWIFGCFQFDDDMIVMSYLFTILNSLQGVLVFIMHCLLSRQVRDEYANILARKWTQRKKSYSEFSSNPNSRSQGSKSVQNTAEMKM